MLWTIKLNPKKKKEQKKKVLLQPLLFCAGLNGAALYIVSYPCTCTVCIYTYTYTLSLIHTYMYVYTYMYPFPLTSPLFPLHIPHPLQECRHTLDLYLDNRPAQTYTHDNMSILQMEPTTRGSVFLPATGLVPLVDLSHYPQ